MMAVVYIGRGHPLSEHKSPTLEHSPDIHPRRKRKLHLLSEEEDEEDRIPLAKSIQAAKEVSLKSVSVMTDASVLEIGKIKLPTCTKCDVMYSNTTCVYDRGRTKVRRHVPLQMTWPCRN